MQIITNIIFLFEIVLTFPHSIPIEFGTHRKHQLATTIAKNIFDILNYVYSLLKIGTNVYYISKAEITSLSLRRNKSKTGTFVLFFKKSSKKAEI